MNRDLSCHNVEASKVGNHDSRVLETILTGRLSKIILGFLFHLSLLASHYRLIIKFMAKKFRLIRYYPKLSNTNGALLPCELWQY